MKGKLNMSKNLLTLDLQLFADEVEEGVNEVETNAESQGEEETSESEQEETGETNGDAEPQPQSDEENARYAAIRRRAEEDARRKYESEMNPLNQQIAAMCQGITHPITGQPITNVHDYVDALAIQQRQASEQELTDKGIDPSVIDRMIAANPVVMQAQRVIEQSQMAGAQYQLQQDLAEITRLDPNIKGIQDLANLPTFPQMLEFVERNKGQVSIVDAYKVFNFGNVMQQTEGAARQQAINQMKGKSHLASPSTSVATESDDVEVPAEIMSRYKEQGKTEKQIRELYNTVAKKLHLN